jgi:predicted metalloprotease with PDZ domain
MIKYIFFQKNPASHYVYIDMHIDNVNSDTVQLQLPAWRPGRYELGNFAKNIKRLDVVNENGKTLAYSKITKDLWELNCKGTKALKVTYSYYSAELNAGACYADIDQIYINPVHCCFYVVGREKEEHELELKIPSDYKIACSMKQNGNVLRAVDFDELTESPFIASRGLQTETYEVNKVKFYLHFNGECKPDFKQIKDHFVKFTSYQLKFWGDFPFDEYHFLFQITPFKFYHGVEHFKNTVIALGPGYELNHGKMYENLVGVSCHELFHAWNIKTIRPKEMLPYNYTKENYAETGFVYEGFTTYYGDKNLFSSNVFSLEQYFETLEERLDKHFNNFGRYNLSVAASSWDNWLDGYVQGAPYRKTSIYDEGNLIAFMLDVMIMEATQNERSLRDVCRNLYSEFGKKNKGYSKEDIVRLCEEAAGKDLKEFFNKFVFSANDFDEGLMPCFNYLGIDLQKLQNHMLSERHFGFKTVEQAHVTKVSLVAPYSPSWKAGLFANDDIIAVNGTVVRNNLNQLLNYHSDDRHIDLSIVSNEKLRTIKLEPDEKGRTWFFKSKLSMMPQLTGKQKDSFSAWAAF